MSVQIKSFDMDIEVYDNLLEKDIADKISGEMSTLKWEFEHYSTSNIFKPNIHWHIPCGDSLDNIKNVGYDDIIFPIWEAAIEKVKNVSIGRCYMNAHTHGIEPHIHRDDGDITMIYYPIMKWKTEWGGGTSVYDNDDETKIPTYVPYVGNRLLTFSASLPHQAMPVARICYQLRSVIVFKCDVNNI